MHTIIIKYTHGYDGNSQIQYIYIYMTNVAAYRISAAVLGFF